LDFVKLGSSLSLRSFLRLGSSLSVFGMTTLGSSLSVLDFVIEAMRRCGLTLIAHAWVSIGRQHKLPDPCDFPDLEHFIFIEVFSLVLCISSGTI
jgi:hypothetical protein